MFCKHQLSDLDPSHYLRILQRNCNQDPQPDIEIPTLIHINAVVPYFINVLLHNI